MQREMKLMEKGRRGYKHAGTKQKGSNKGNSNRLDEEETEEHLSREASAAAKPKRQNVPKLCPSTVLKIAKKPLLPDSPFSHNLPLQLFPLSRRLLPTSSVYPFLSNRTLSTGPLLLSRQDRDGFCFTCFCSRIPRIRVHKEKHIIPFV